MGPVHCPAGQELIVGQAALPDLESQRTPHKAVVPGFKAEAGNVLPAFRIAEDEAVAPAVLYEPAVGRGGLEMGTAAGGIDVQGQAGLVLREARPGFSEHQTGLALDINTASRSAHFETTATYRWLIENCWRYGFILRYPEGREDITGFCFEPWHYRFVGRTLALQVRESGLTYDEFLARRAVDRPHTALCAGDMPLEAVPILLDGICWLPAQAVAAAFGRTAAISGDQLVLPAEEGSVVLTAGSLTGERDDRPFALSSLPFQWEGEFYLSLEDLCALLELTARREEGLISLVPRSAPSALLPEELPPIQPLPC